MCQFSTLQVQVDVNYLQYVPSSLKTRVYRTTQNQRISKEKQNKEEKNVSTG